LGLQLCIKRKKERKKENQELQHHMTENYKTTLVHLLRTFQGHTKSAPLVSIILIFNDTQGSITPELQC
jgi:hypothetical protein